MKLTDLAQKHSSGQQPGTATARPRAQPLAQTDAQAQGGDAELRKAATEVLRIFDTGVGNAGITGADWLVAMAELRAALGQTR